MRKHFGAVVSGKGALCCPGFITGLARLYLSFLSPLVHLLDHERFTYPYQGPRSAADGRAEARLVEEPGSG